MSEPRRILICGHGRMGSAVAEVAIARGHHLVGSVSRNRDGDFRDVASAVAATAPDVVIDFTRAEHIDEVVRACLAARVPLVTGTTGWNDRASTILKMVSDAGGTLLFASNFSIGVQLFLRAAEHTASLYARAGGWDVGVEERHHRMKADAPSGTALSLARRVLATTPAKKRLATTHSGAVAPDELHVASLRCGSEFGRHTLLFDGEDDWIELRHSARGRRGFASGAVRAAEWIIGRRGVFTVDQWMDDLLGPPAPAGA